MINKIYKQLNFYFVSLFIKKKKEEEENDSSTTQQKAKLFSLKYIYTYSLKNNFVFSSC